MTIETATLFFALLACVLALLVVGIGLSFAFDRPDKLGLRAAVRPLALEGAAAVAMTCTVGSLYLSEVAGFIPCRLCWVQRGFMYPAAALLLAALVTRKQGLALVGAGLALLGLPVSIFHRVEQSSGEVGGFCDPTNPCSGRWVDQFGFITIPTMAAVGFVGILVLVGLSRSNS